MISKRENTFYLVIAGAVLIFELGIPSGLSYCFLPVMVLGVIGVGLWAFPKRPA